ncbi:hypothetical protein DF186_18720, partial [Enterococcus hirae]
IRQQAESAADVGQRVVEGQVGGEHGLGGRPGERGGKPGRAELHEVAVADADDDERPLDGHVVAGRREGQVPRPAVAEPAGAPRVAL